MAEMDSFERYTGLYVQWEDAGFERVRDGD
jgi:hypothetical protein